MQLITYNKVSMTYRCSVLNTVYQNLISISVQVLTYNSIYLSLLIRSQLPRPLLTTYKMKHRKLIKQSGWASWLSKPNQLIEEVILVPLVSSSWELVKQYSREKINSWITVQSHSRNLTHKKRSTFSVDCFVYCYIYLTILNGCM